MEGPFKTNFFNNEVQRVLYKLVLVTYPLKIILGGFTALQIYSKKIVPITT